jgi:hypothetical protein
MFKNQELAETAIREARKTVDYNTVEYPLEYFIDKDNDCGYSAIDDHEQLIDGKQRLFTALNFVNGNLQLSNLKVLNSLNGFTFKDLPLYRQRRFQRITVRAIAVNPKSDLSLFTRY